MSFNQKAKNQHVKFNTINHEGEKAHTLTPELELYTLVCTCALSNQFYRNNDDTMKRLGQLIFSVDSKFAKNLAIYAREKMYLRTIPLVIAVLLAKQGKCDKHFVYRIIQRADEITELLAIWSFLNGGKKLSKISTSIKKGIALSFGKFDAYQLAKYEKKGKEIKLRDAMRITHPKPEDKKREKLYNEIVNRTLITPYTWETELSTAAKNGKTKKQVWEELIKSEKVGIMALIRNLRNILEADVSRESIKKVAGYISSEDAVRKSKQLPFRFLSAYREIQKVNHLDSCVFMDALEKAIIHSCENIPGFDGQTLLIASDVSGSMTQNVSQKSKIEYYDIGLTLSMMLQSKTRCYTGTFGDIFKIKQFPKDNIICNVMTLRNIANEVGYSTNGYKVIQWLLENKKKVDKVMIFTDCQLWDSYYDNRSIVKEWIKYKAFNHEAKLYLFDLAGYGNVPLKINEKDVFLIAGWSDKIFDVLAALDKGDSVVDVINGVE